MERHKIEKYDEVIKAEVRNIGYWDYEELLDRVVLVAADHILSSQGYKRRLDLFNTVFEEADEGRVREWAFG